MTATSTILSIILSSAVSAVVTGIIGYLVKRSLDKYFEKKGKEEAEYKAKLEELNDLKQAASREEHRKDLTEVISSSILPIEEKLTKLHEKLDTNTEASTMLLRDAMKTDLLRCEAQDFATELDKFNWQELYNSYRKCGGNHFKEMVDTWRDRINALPNEKNNQNN